MVCGGEARCQKVREVGRREMETWDKEKREKRKEEGNGNSHAPWQEDS